MDEILFHSGDGEMTDKILEDVKRYIEFVERRKQERQGR